MDESGVQLNNKIGKVLAKKGAKAVKSVTFGENGETITVVACCNSIGNFLQPVLIIKGLNKKPEFEEGLPPDLALGELAQERESNPLNDQEPGASGVSALEKRSQDSEQSLVLNERDQKSSLSKQVPETDCFLRLEFLPSRALLEYAGNGAKAAMRSDSCLYHGTVSREKTLQGCGELLAKVGRLVAGQAYLAQNYNMKLFLEAVELSSGT
ncbi:unnamed protein product [Leptidea sinapis]|uniref:DDE-1 domain-containing protein n=1 Tax=Leptidea sinapis TaxID=189913 RepID=A0A5E4R6R1_9NEOP|nr:unnamed protein product [Leptidea sinapis]